jgi:hypothetical protein
MQEGHMKDKAWLQRLVRNLVDENRRPLRELPEPVGKTVRVTQTGSGKEPLVIDEPSAEVLRSREPLKLGEDGEYDVQIDGVFKTNGACKIKILGTNSIVSGKISDPSLEEPKNIYTQALNEGAVLHVRAKPTLKEGKIQKLFITAASSKPPSDQVQKEPTPVLA